MWLTFIALAPRKQGDEVLGVVAVLCECMGVRVLLDPNACSLARLHSSLRNLVLNLFVLLEYLIKAQFSHF